MSLSSGPYLGSHSTVSQWERAASAAVIERSHHRDLLGLTGCRHTQVGTAFGPCPGQIRMGQRLALVGEEKHDIAGLSLRLPERQLETHTVDGVGVLTSLQGVLRPSQKAGESNELRL